MSCRIKCSKGSKAEDTKFFEFAEKDLSITDPEDPRFLSLEDLRKCLVAKKFIGADGDTCIWRFVSSKVKEDEKGKIKYSDRIVGIGSEEIYPVKRLIINQENEVIISNVGAVQKPDLIGFATDYFNNGKIKVSCQLRTDMPGDTVKNKDKFPPVMMTDLISTNEESDMIYKFACICCEDSVIKFPVESFGSVGFVLKAELNNEIIYDSAIKLAKGKHDLYGVGYVNCMRKDGKTFDLVVKNLTKDTSVVPGTGIRYQKITIYTYDMLSWYDGEQDHEVTIEEARANDKGLLAGSLQSGILPGRSLQSEQDKQQITLPSDGYDPGKISQGDEVKFSYGKWHRRKVSEERLGSVSIYMFVFKTEEDAEKIIGRYNSLTESNQLKFWGLA